MDGTRSLVRSHPLFQAVSDAALDALLAGSPPRAFSSGEILLRQGDPSDSAILIVEGEVEILAQTSYGPVQLTTISGMALLGEIGVLAGLPRTATVRALRSGHLLSIGREVFSRVADEHPSILRYVIAQLGDRVSSFNQAVGVYTNALAALEREEFDAEMLDRLNNPSAELMNFAATFRKMADQILIKRQQREEMTSAAAIQRAMLPNPLPDDAPHRRVQLFAAMRPARHVGGDFYDAFFLDPDRLAISIGDVSGKGVPASLFMAVCQTTMRMALRDEPDLGRAVERANDLLEAENSASMFATFFGAILDLRTGRLSYCNGGHNPPVIQRADGTLERLDPNGIALGVLSPADYETAEAMLHPGDRVLLYTDGVTEAHDRGDDLFEDERLAEAMAGQRQGGVRELVEGVFAAVDAFADGAAQHDDVTCLALAYCGPGGSAGPS